jgi:hypothetical protein
MVPERSENVQGPAPLGELIPRPDPSTLTTAQLIREIAALREILETKSEGKQELFDMRVVNVDETTKRIILLLDRIPGLIEKEVSTLKTLHDEKFRGVEKQFQERDTRVDEGAKANQIKVDAAFAAQKEAVGEQNKSYKEATAKSEEGVEKRIDQQVVLLAEMRKGLDDKINANTQRLDDKIEATRKASEDKVEDIKDRIVNRTDKGKEDYRATLAIVIAAAVGIFETFQFMQGLRSPEKIPSPPIVVRLEQPSAQPSLPTTTTTTQPAR